MIAATRIATPAETIRYQISNSIDLFKSERRSVITVNTTSRSPTAPSLQEVLASWAKATIEDVLIALLGQSQSAAIAVHEERVAVLNRLQVHDMLGQQRQRHIGPGNPLELVADVCG